MTLEARTAAAHAVLRSIAHTDDPDCFWEVISVPADAEPFSPEAEAWLYATLEGIRYYPRGILAHIALGNSVRGVDVRLPARTVEREQATG